MTKILYIIFCAVFAASTVIELLELLAFPSWLVFAIVCGLAIFTIIFAILYEESCLPAKPTK